MSSDFLPLDRRTFLAGATAAAAVSGLRIAVAEAGATSARIVGLRAEYLQTPLGLEARRPALSWRIDGAQHGLRQATYRITAATDPTRLASGSPDLWDSGRVLSSATLGIVYDGPPLISRQRVYWRVEAWDGANNPLPPSEPSWWEMGLLDAADWQAEWIAAEDELSRGDRHAGLFWIWGEPADHATPRRFRFRFTLQEQPVEAVLLLAVHDQLRGVWIHGEPVPYKPFRPGPIDLGRMLTIPLPVRKGDNVLAVEAGIREDNLPLAAAGAVSALVRLRYADGRYERLTTSADWRTAPAALDLAEWRRPQFDDRSWHAARPAATRPIGEPWPAAPAMLLRRTFRLERAPRSARLYITALGAYEARLNGARVGDNLLAPESTDFRKRVLYQVYDVGKQLQAGDNMLGAIVGDGWYGSATLLASRFSYGPSPRRLLAQLEISYEDGHREIITTDQHWHQAESAIRSAEIFDGEIYDARRDQRGWDHARFDALSWQSARMAESPPCVKVAQCGPPIRVHQRLKPASICAPSPGVHVFDFGQNFSGWTRLRARAPAGTTIELRYAEILAADGNIDQSNLRTAEARDIYTFRGDDGEETYEPHFTYHGFRYVALTGWPGKLPDDMLEGVVITSATPPTGTLRLADPLLEGIWRNTLWGQRSNFLGIPTDCPQRDERMGWLGDAQIFVDAAAFNSDVDAFMRRFMGDIRDAQLANGAFSDFCPTPWQDSMKGSPGWADAGIIVPWTLWWRYGDTQVIDENWDAMVRFSEHVLRENPDYLWRRTRGMDYGDWLALDAKQPGDETTPKDLVATAFWAQSTKMLAEMAAASGRQEEAVRYRALYQRIASAFVSAFVRSDGTIGNGSQTGYILPLRFGLVPQHLRDAAANNLVVDIRRRGTVLSTGFLGTPHALDVLADSGHADIAYALLRRTTYPSWGYMIAKGATTMWERWNSDVGDVSMNSFNHYAFGAVVAFFYRRIAGIDAASPGFRRQRIRPLPNEAMTRGGGDFDAMPGRITTDWSYQPGQRFSLRLVVPANTKAEVHLPATSAQSIYEGGRVVTSKAGSDVRTVARNRAESIVEVESGHWSFEVR